LPQGLLDDAYCAGADVCRDDALEVGCDIDHVGAVLPGAHDPVDFLRCRIVSTDHLRALGGEPGLPGDKGQAVRAVQRPKIDGRQRLLSDEIDDREGVVTPASVIGDVSRLAIGGGDDFVRIFEDRNFSDYLERGWVDDGERSIALGERKQRRLRRGLGAGGGNESDFGESDVAKSPTRGFMKETILPESLCGEMVVDSIPTAGSERTLKIVESGDARFQRSSPQLRRERRNGSTASR
jgi:hypothetical protein